VKKPLFFLFLLACFHPVRGQLLPAFGASRVATTGFQFLKIAPDARSAGMGGAVCAGIHDLASVYWNPAGLTRLDSSHLQLQVSDTRYFAGVQLQFVALAHRFKGGSVVAVSYTGLNTGVMDVTTEFEPSGNGQTFRAYDQELALSYAKKLTTQFSFGISGKYIEERFAEQSTRDGVVDFGFQYEVGKANLRFSAGISNFGFTTEPRGSIIIETLQGFDTVAAFGKMAVPSIFRLGLHWDALKGAGQLLSFAAQLNHPTDNHETFGLGAEYSYHQLLYVRSGYELGADEGGLPAFGFGIRYKRRFGVLQLDYGFQEKNKLGSVHRITLSASLF